MKKGLSYLLLTILTMGTFSCNNVNEVSSSEEKHSSSEVTTSEVIIKPGYARYDLKDPLKRKTEGYGAQFDTCIIDINNSSTDWNKMIEAVKISNLQAVRIRFYPEMYERGNDNNDPNYFDYDSKNVDFNSSEMQHLYKLLDLFEENHVNVDLSWYGCRTTFHSEDGKYNGSWLGGTYGVNGVSSWMVAPSSEYVLSPDAEFAESVAACLNYLINIKKYTCIYEYSIFPEPEGVISDMNLYKSISLKIKDNLIKYGIKDKILFSGPADYGNNHINLDEVYLNKGYGYDKVDSSVYKFHGEINKDGNKTTPSENEEMLTFAKNHVDVCEKYNLSWGVAECGTSNFLTAVTNADTELFDRAMTMTRFFINLSNAGCTNIKYFIFADCNYDGILNEEGMIRYLKQYYEDSEIDYQAKPIWYAWSLIMKYSDIGSTIYPITNDYSNNQDKDVCMVALKLPDNSWSYFMTNIGQEAKKVAICNPFDKNIASLNQYRLTAASTPFGSEATIKLIEKGKDIETINGVSYVSIPKNGIIVLSNKK